MLTLMQFARAAQRHQRQGVVVLAPSRASHPPPSLHLSCTRPAHAPHVAGSAVGQALQVGQMPHCGPAVGAVLQSMPAPPPLVRRPVRLLAGPPTPNEPARCSGTHGWSISPMCSTIWSPKRTSHTYRSRQSGTPRPNVLRVGAHGARNKGACSVLAPSARGSGHRRSSRTCGRHTRQTWHAHENTAPARQVGRPPSR